MTGHNCGHGVELVAEDRNLQTATEGQGKPQTPPDLGLMPGDNPYESTLRRLVAEDPHR